MAPSYTLSHWAPSLSSLFDIKPSLRRDGEFLTDFLFHEIRAYQRGTY